jgi:hypothetical protein
MVQREVIPEASRPQIPGYPIADAQGGSGLLPWSWAEERLVAAHNYWLSTVRPDGRPHAMPVWGVWLEGSFAFSTGADTRKARNFGGNPRCVVTTERADEAVILEGRVETLGDATYVDRFLAAYNAKYHWDMDLEWGPFYAVRPHVAFGFVERADQFGNTATRWRFHTP